MLLFKVCDVGSKSEVIPRFVVSGKEIDGM